jgi:hypothetical protein
MTSVPDGGPLVSSWPTEPAGFLFLGRALQATGEALFPSDWQPGDLAAELHADDSAETEGGTRLAAARKHLVSKILDGSLHAYFLHAGTGELLPMKSSLWMLERVVQRIWGAGYKIDVADPEGQLTNEERERYGDFHRHQTDFRSPIFVDAAGVRALTSPHSDGAAKPMERAAEQQLRRFAEAFARGDGDVPVRAKWEEDASSLFGLGPRPAGRVWGKVAADHPALADRRGKPKRRR